MGLAMRVCETYTLKGAVDVPDNHQNVIQSYRD